MSKLIADNRKARFNYEILEDIECGIVLEGTELKPLRHGKSSLSDAYAKIIGGELFLMQMHIPKYVNGTYNNHDENRKRKLLLHKNEILRLERKLDEKHLTAIPLKIFFNSKGFVKVIIGIGRGKNTHDKRDSIKKRDSDRDLKRIMKNF
jgi:SsrA-binding protein